MEEKTVINENGQETVVEEKLPFAMRHPVLVNAVCAGVGLALSVAGWIAGNKMTAHFVVKELGKK